MQQDAERGPVSFPSVQQVRRVVDERRRYRVLNRYRVVSLYLCVFLHFGEWGAAKVKWRKFKAQRLHRCADLEPTSY